LIVTSRLSFDNPPDVHYPIIVALILNKQPQKSEVIGMSVNETHARIQAQVWQAVQQSGLDVSGIKQETLTALIEFASEAALMVVDTEMEVTMAEEQGQESKLIDEDIMLDNKEDVLWEGRPFLSISLHYTITDERIRITSGIFGRAHENIELVRIQDINYKQTMSERMINIGDIFIHSHDPSNPRTTLINIKDPEAVYEILRRAVLQARKRHGFTYREEM
jgi:hypothetical protein